MVVCFENEKRVFNEVIADLECRLLQEENEAERQKLKAQIHNFKNDLEHLYAMEKRINENT